MRRILALLFVLAWCGLALARDTELLDTGWRFKLGDADGAEAPGFKDDLWQTVSLPHNWGW